MKQSADAGNNNRRKREAEVDDQRFIFVYGSLKRGYALHHHLQLQRFCATAYTERAYRLFNLGDYPGLVESDVQPVSVSGEVFEVDAECLRQLDMVEGVCDGFYQRRPIRLSGSFRGQLVWAYFWLLSTKNCPDCGSSWPP